MEVVATYTNHAGFGDSSGEFCFIYFQGPETKILGRREDRRMSVDRPSHLARYPN